MRKKFFKNKTFWLGAAALVLAGGLTMQSASAYFTTYVTAKGGYQVDFGEDTEIEENLTEMTKHIIIQNTGDGSDATSDEDVYVRVKAFSGSQFGLEYSNGTSLGKKDVDDETLGTGTWSEREDGYWYYSEILKPGENTSVLDAKITGIPEDYKDSFNIIVVQECTPVRYDANGEPYADWSATEISTTDIGTADGTQE